MLDLRGSRNRVGRDGTGALVGALRVNEALAELHVDTLRASGRDAMPSRNGARWGVARSLSQASATCLHATQRPRRSSAMRVALTPFRVD